jgi:UDP-N-acetylglucosamine acyltransferase
MSFQGNNLQNIHPDARIGDNVQIDVRLGKNCRIFPGAILGSIPQDIKFKGEYSTLEIGNNVTIREYCTINRGTDASGKTVIKDNCLLMAYVHVAHDCQIGANCILANNVTLAGHIEVGEFAVFGGMAAAHQFVKVGAHTMISGGALVIKDVPPYVKAGRTPLSYAGVNSIGLKRRGFSREQIHAIQDIYRVLFVRGNNITQAIQIIEDSLPDSLEKSEILHFIMHSERGLLKGFRAHRSDW